MQTAWGVEKFAPERLGRVGRRACSLPGTKIGFWRRVRFQLEASFAQKGIILSAQVFISATDTSAVSVLTELGQPEKLAFFPRCVLCHGLPQGQLQDQTSPLGETGFLPLYHASHDDRMTGREGGKEGGRGGEGRGEKRRGKQRKREERRGKDPLWCWCQHWLSVNRKVT